MAGFWKSLPSWVRNIVVPILLLIVAWKVFWTIVGVVAGIVGFAINVLVLVGIAAVVVILLKKAAKS
ncbi:MULTISPECIES: hypothetical protein [Kitasatospora]|uniref:Uncharacterized protein n=1 Tax=Kitasatospora setae (strain ATCC 33774 / DSM 43861 / JCM 3304 / KCC A-0304 / NBRC 14216 / KM-6054) TaxID=452652 RepID=E4NEJ1_KITSK|nr:MULTISPECIES: hypothetical protein [Kitasatospora]BAJ29777.1 hypothetical protein KSE_39810 [Kitasatospora setae KM-6054]